MGDRQGFGDGWRSLKWRIFYLSTTQTTNHHQLCPLSFIFIMTISLTHMHPKILAQKKKKKGKFVPSWVPCLSFLKLQKPNIIITIEKKSTVQGWRLYIYLQQEEDIIRLLVLRQKNENNYFIRKVREIENKKPFQTKNCILCFSFLRTKKLDIFIKHL